MVNRGGVSKPAQDVCWHHKLPVNTNRQALLAKYLVLSAHTTHFTIVCAGKDQYDILSVHDKGVKVSCDANRWCCSIVVSRKYVPPFATIALVQTAGGAYTWDVTFWVQNNWVKHDLIVGGGWGPSAKRRDVPDVLQHWGVRKQGASAK